MFTATAPAVGTYDTLAAFQTCLANDPPSADPLNPATDKVCQLQAGTYVVHSPLEIGRSRITIKGVGRYATILRRGSANTDSILKTKPNVKLNRIYIEDLAFDGARPFGEIATPNVGADLGIDAIDGTSAACDEGVAGTCGLRVRNVRFYNAMIGAIAMQPAISYPAIRPNHPTRGVLIENSEFLRSLRAPIHVALHGAWWPRGPVPAQPGPFQANQIDIGGACDAGTAGQGQQYQANPLRYNGLPSTAVNDILIRNNLFENNDTGALGIDAAFGIQIASNAMLDNYNQGLDCGGGVVAVGHCAKNIDIDNNFIWNRNVYAWPATLCAIAQAAHPNAVDKYTLAPALELWGTDISVTNNHFEYLTTSGIEATAVERLTITNNLIQNTSRGIQDNLPASAEDDRPGVQIANCNAPVGLPDAYRPQVDFVTVAGNDIRNKGSIYQSYGVRLRHDACGGSPVGMNAISIQAIPSGDNRQGDACRSSSITLSSSTTVLPCIDPVSLGLTVYGNTCGTSGCR